MLLAKDGDDERYRKVLNHDIKNPSLMSTNGLLDDDDFNEQSTAEPQKPAAEVSGLYTFLLIVLSTTQGYFMGYSNSLSTIFREEGMSSDRVAYTTIIIYPTFISFLGAPIVDRYYNTRLGKRKTYLVPCKIILIAAHVWLSFSIDQLVEAKEVEYISKVMFLIGLVQVFELNASAGLRFDLYGPEGAGKSMFIMMISLMLGMLVGFQGFILLNSDHFCKETLGFSRGKLLTERDLQLIFAGLNLLGLLGCMVIKEKRETGDEQVATLGNIRLLVILFKDANSRRALLWFTFSCFGIIAIKDLCSFEMLKDGFPRETFVLIIIGTLPTGVISNLILSKVVKPGLMAKGTAYFTFQHLVLVSISLYAILAYKEDKNNFKAGVFLFINTLLEQVSPWMGCHFAFVNTITHKDLAATYSGLMLGIINLGKIIPLTIGYSIVDDLQIMPVFVSFQVANLLFAAASYFMIAPKIDEVPIEAYSKAVDDNK